MCYHELRLLAAGEDTLNLHDEIEHIGLYNKINHYHGLRVEDVSRFTFDPSYMRDIDRYFIDRSACI